MNPHDRYRAFMHFQPVDQVPLQEWGPWEETTRRWMRESGKSESEVLSWRRELDCEDRVPVDFSMQPPFDEQVIAEDDAIITRVDSMGQTFREFKDNPAQLAEYLSGPVRTPSDWKEVKRRLDPGTPGRYPANWNELVSGWRRKQPIVRLYGYVQTYYGGPSLFGFVRMLMGNQGALYAFYDEPAMVRDMMETATEFSIAMLEKALREAPVTLVQFWEDMCYKSGPLISPALVRKFMLPCYQRITAAIHQAGVDIIFLDSDGNIEQLLPLWLESGINGHFPMEQQAGNDILAYRKKYGRDLLMQGGIDKRALVHGRAAIDRELESKIPLAFEGGYVPGLDHTIPPDVPYDHFMYYWERKKRLLSL